MYFSFFKLKKRGKKTAETRRRNCAVLPKLQFTTHSGKNRLRMHAGAVFYV